MNDLVERYVQQVGVYLPGAEQADITAELRSEILDQIEDQYGPEPNEADVIHVLQSFDHPQRMAASFHPDHYLIGPAFYPILIHNLHATWMMVPTIVLFLSIFTALNAPQPVPVIRWLTDTILSISVYTVIFSGFVVFIVASIERYAIKINRDSKAFNPLELPDPDAPSRIDYVEEIFGIIFGMFITLLLLDALYRQSSSTVGSLTLGEATYIRALVGCIAAMTAVNVAAIWRQRWTATLLFIRTMFELGATICLYFVLYKPVIPQISFLQDLSFIAAIPIALTVLTLVGTVIGRGSRLIQLQDNSGSTFTPESTKEAFK